MATCINNNSLFSATSLNDGKFISVCRFAYIVSVTNSKPDWNRSRVKAIKEKIDEIESPSSISSAQDVVEKFGLEASLWEVVASQDWPEITKYVGLVCAQAH